MTTKIVFFFKSKFELDFRRKCALWLTHLIYEFIENEGISLLFFFFFILYGSINPKQLEFRK